MHHPNSFFPKVCWGIRATDAVGVDVSQLSLNRVRIPKTTFVEEGRWGRDLWVRQGAPTLSRIDGDCVAYAANHVTDPGPQAPLNIGEARGVDQHRGMGRLLSSHIPDRARDNECAHRSHKAARQHIDRMVDLVLQRQDILTILNQPDVTVARLEEHFLRSE